jgi:hypothetical protein
MYENAKINSDLGVSDEMFSNHENPAPCLSKRQIVAKNIKKLSKPKQDPNTILIESQAQRRIDEVLEFIKSKSGFYTKSSKGGKINFKAFHYSFYLLGTL